MATNPANRLERPTTPLAEALKAAFTDLHDRLRFAEEDVSGLKQNQSSVVDSLVAQITANFSALFTKAHALTTAIEQGAFVFATTATPVHFTEGLTVTLILDGGSDLPFIPSTVVGLVRDATAEDFAFAKVTGWNASTRAITLEIFAAAGDDGPHNDVRVEIGALATLAMLTMLEEVEALRLAVGLDKTAVETDRQNAAASADAAGSASTAAIAARGLAQKWASEVEDVTVDAGLYSARHYANKAAISAAAAALFDPSSFWTKAESYSKTQVDAIADAKAGAASTAAALAGKADASAVSAALALKADAAATTTALAGKAAVVPYNYPTADVNPMVVGNVYIFDSSGGARVGTLPSVAGDGDRIVVGRKGQHSVTVDRNTRTIGGLTENAVLNMDKIKVAFVRLGTNWIVMDAGRIVK